MFMIQSVEYAKANILGLAEKRTEKWLDSVNDNPKNIDSFVYFFSAKLVKWLPIKPGNIIESQFSGTQIEYYPWADI